MAKVCYCYEMLLLSDTSVEQEPWEPYILMLLHAKAFIFNHTRPPSLHSAHSLMLNNKIVNYTKLTIFFLKGTKLSKMTSNMITSIHSILTAALHIVDAPCMQQIHLHQSEFCRVFSLTQRINVWESAPIFYLTHTCESE